MIKRPTRYGEYSASLIDNIFTNHINESQISGIILEDMSDHLPIFCITQGQSVPTNKFITKIIRLINDTTVPDLSNKLNDVDWSILDSKNPDDAYETFHNIINKVYNEALPLQVKRYRVHLNKPKPWITTSLLNSIKKKHALYKKISIY